MKYFETRAQSLRNLFTIFLVWTYLFVSLRIYVRCQLARIFGADDLFLFATLASFWAYITSGALSVEHGIGSNPDEFDDTNSLSIGLRFWFLAELFYILSVSFLRISASLQLRKLANKTSQQWTIFGLSATSTVCGIGFFFLVLFQCTPIQYFWTGYIGANGSCLDQVSMANAGYVFAGVGTLIDMSLALLPIWLYHGEELTRREQSSMRVLMFFGLLASAVACLRIPSTKLLLDTNDYFFDAVPIAICSIVELGLGIMVLSAAAYRPLCPEFYGDSGTIRLTTPTAVFAQNEKSPATADPHHHQSVTSGVQAPPRKSVFRTTVSENGRESPSRPISPPLFSHIMTSEGMVPIMELRLNLRGTE